MLPLLAVVPLCEIIGVVSGVAIADAIMDD